MKTQKMSLANIQGKLSRAEMKNIMAGSGGRCYTQCDINGANFYSDSCGNNPCPFGGHVVWCYCQ